MVGGQIVSARDKSDGSGKAVAQGLECLGVGAPTPVCQGHQAFRMCPEFTGKQVSILFGSIAVGEADKFAEAGPSHCVFSNQTNFGKAFN